MHRYVCVGLFLSIAAPQVFGSPVRLTADESRSSARVTLCMNVSGSSVCDDDTSPIAGYAVISLDCLLKPTRMSLYDFRFHFTEDINVSLDFRFLGRLNATASNIEIVLVAPEPPLPPTPLMGETGDQFSYVDVLSASTGQISYNATSVVCLVMQGYGQPCSGTRDLGQQQPQPTTLNGAVHVSGRDLELRIDLNTSGPIDPNNPGLGTLSIEGAVYANGRVPLPSMETFLAVLTGYITEPDPICESDINADGITNGADIQPYVNALLTP